MGLATSVLTALKNSSRDPILFVTFESILEKSLTSALIAKRSFLIKEPAILTFESTLKKRCAVVHTVGKLFPKSRYGNLVKILQ
jgi:hypothetical protein